MKIGDSGAERPDGLRDFAFEIDPGRSEAAPAASITLHWMPSAGSISFDLWSTTFPPPLEGLWWYRALEKSGLEQQFQFAYGVIERDGRGIGIVPTFVMDLPIDIVAPRFVAAAIRIGGRLASWLRYQRTLFVGSPCSDEGTLGLVRGHSPTAVLGVAQQALEERAREVGASMIVWKDFPAEAKCDLDGVAASHGL